VQRPTELRVRDFAELEIQVNRSYPFTERFVRGFALDVSFQ
jgi:hypothetical protein